LGTNLVFALGPRKTTENLDLIGRSRDLPDRNNIRGVFCAVRAGDKGEFEIFDFDMVKHDTENIRSPPLEDDTKQRLVKEGRRLGWTGLMWFSMDTSGGLW
jgi:hypothetical protein